jgi:hypothetical protein
VNLSDTQIPEGMNWADYCDALLHASAGVIPFRPCAKWRETTFSDQITVTRSTWSLGCPDPARPVPRRGERLAAEAAGIYLD